VKRPPNRAAPNALREKATQERSMRRSSASDNGGTLSESEIGFVLRGAQRKTGPEMLRHVAAAKAGPGAAKRKAAPAHKAKRSAKRRKA
jgi:hypothetical protein